MFGDKIKLLLVKNNITQKDLAKRLNISEAAVSKYISNERMPQANAIADIATALNTTCDYLLDNDNTCYDYKQCEVFLARSERQLTKDEKMKLISILLGDK